MKRQKSMEKLVDDVGASIGRRLTPAPSIPILLQDFIGSRQHMGPHGNGKRLVGFMVRSRRRRGQHSTKSIPVQIVSNEWGGQFGSFSGIRPCDGPELRRIPNQLQQRRSVLLLSHPHDWIPAQIEASESNWWSWSIVVVVVVVDKVRRVQNWKFMNAIEGKIQMRHVGELP
jgi:hypothetical protein